MTLTIGEALALALTASERARGSDVAKEVERELRRQGFAIIPLPFVGQDDDRCKCDYIETTPPGGPFEYIRGKTNGCRYHGGIE
jgi:hypothetical protein